MTMRRAEPNDVAAVTELTVRAYAPYTEAFGYPPIPATEDYAPRIAAGEVWLLEEEAGLVGAIVLEEKADSLEIFSVAVDPHRQRHGLGRRLLSFAEEQARERGQSAVTLYTNARMSRNIDLYARFGFQETGRRPNPARPGWTIVDMRKELATSFTRRTA